jgi:peptidyl-prolyl cis-trans isomerase C
VRPVIVEGVEIEPEAIAREMQNHPAETPAESWREAARALVVRQLLLSEAARRGLHAEAAQGEPRGETDEESLIRAVLEEAIEPAAPSDLECRRVFDGLKEKFVTPTLFEAAHILIEPAGEGPAAWREAEAEVRQIIDLVGDDRQAFAEAAAARSACPTAHQGGSLGQIRRGELAPPVQAALENLAEGVTGREPVRSRFGWHAVRLERRIEGRALPYDVVEDKIRDMLEARAWALGAAQYVAELAARSQIQGVELTPPDAGFSACEEGKGC